jgi:hypothetical protein
MAEEIVATSPLEYVINGAKVGDQQVLLVVHGVDRLIIRPFL